MRLELYQDGLTDTEIKTFLDFINRSSLCLDNDSDELDMITISVSSYRDGADIQPFDLKSAAGIRKHCQPTR